MSTIPASMALNAYARAAGMGGSPQLPQPGTAGQAGGFSDLLKQAKNETGEIAKVGETQVGSVTGGAGRNPVAVMTAVADGGARLRTVVAGRHQAITAHQEI